ncbi:hypothetical protein BaRGS_00027440 [Batillaria attramentaria]|uniref:TrmE-type G domain-containing protein n=1 Tax=Batillaria attramentaria TaxID=370345 RepID=A0ABD0K3D5_9CAEN
MILRTVTSFSLRGGLFRATASCSRFYSSATNIRNTVYALSSGHGRCGVAVIRVSGPSCSDTVQLVCRRQGLPAPRHAALRRLFDPVTGEVIDKGLVLWFPGPGSFTGEDCAEFHVHGGTAVVAAMLDALGRLPGLRPAEPGDFTRRAFLNGKMGLTEVEGLGDLIHADTAAQRQQAVRQMEGDLGQMYGQWRSRMLKCLASVEAYIDFSEDENIEEDTVVRATEEVERLGQEVEHHLSDNRRGERLRDGVHVVIVGEPNVGKSSLLNALCQRPAAIVSPLAGTTRDIVETGINLAGYPVLLSDTAGLREAGDVVEKEGVRRALDRASKADLRVLVLDSPSVLQSKLPQITWVDFLLDHMRNLGLTTAESSCSDVMSAAACGANTVSTASSVRTMMSSGHDDGGFLDSSALRSAADTLDNVIVVLNKCDLLEEEEGCVFPCAKDLGVTVCSVSCTTSQGLDAFVATLADHVKQLCGDPLCGTPSLTQARHRSHLTQCLHHLRTFMQQVANDDLVLAAEALRRAMRELGHVTGAVSVEDVLDVVFKDFCIGK